MYFVVWKDKNSVESWCCTDRAYFMLTVNKLAEEHEILHVFGTHKLFEYPDFSSKMLRKIEPVVKTTSRWE